MIREERDPAFWDKVAHHPQVSQAAIFGLPVSLADVVQHESVMPLASEHGGYLFARLDGLGRVWELHSMFTPEGRGREAMTAAVEAFERMFAMGAQVITTYEVDGNPRSRPPKAFGFQRAGEFAPANGHDLRSWVLTETAWRARTSKVGLH